MQKHYVWIGSYIGNTYSQVFPAFRRSSTSAMYVLQWNLSIMDTIGKQHFAPYSEVSGFRYISSRRGTHNHVEHNVAAFAVLSLAVHWQGRLRRG